MNAKNIESNFILAGAPAKVREIVPQWMTEDYAVQIKNNDRGRFPELPNRNEGASSRCPSATTPLGLS